MKGPIKKELVIVQVSDCKDHHDVCRFITKQAERINAWEILVLPPGAEISYVSGHSGFIDMVNLSDEEIDMVSFPDEESE